MLQHPCIPCQHGDHDGHIGVPEAASEGMMGGWSCPCRGECRSHAPSEPVFQEWTAAEYEQFTALTRALSGQPPEGSEG